jgi:hypothetical protein
MPGADGRAATVTVGSVTTGAAGSQAQVVNSGTSTDAVLNFTIPEGAQGPPGSYMQFQVESGNLVLEYAGSPPDMTFAINNGELEVSYA